MIVLEQASYRWNNMAAHQSPRLCLWESFKIFENGAVLHPLANKSNMMPIRNTKKRSDMRMR